MLLTEPLDTGRISVCPEAPRRTPGTQGWVALRACMSRRGLAQALPLCGSWAKRCAQSGDEVSLKGGPPLVPHLRPLQFLPL